MIYKNIKPKKVASLSVFFDKSYQADSFKHIFDSRILKTPLEIKCPGNGIGVFSIINKFISEIGFICPNAKGSSHLAWEAMNQNIHIIGEQKAYLAVEVVLSTAGKSKFKASVDFYIVDNKATYTKNKREIIIPQNSIVFQVNKEQLFKTYEEGGKYFFIRTSISMKEVDLYTVAGKHYVHKNKDNKTLVKVDIIDNSAEISSSVIKVEKPDADQDTVDVYSSFDRKRIILKKDLFKIGDSIFAEEIDGSTIEIRFKACDLCDVNPSLSGRVRAILVDNKLYISSTVA